MTRLAGHLLVEALVAQGVDTAFGVPGESYLAVLDGFHEHRDRIRFVACRHESGAAFMADAHARLTGRPGVCFVTRGPGATNAAIGVHTAFQDSTPLILFVGQVASDQRDREAFQEIDFRQMFGPGTLGMAKWVGEVHDAHRLPEYVARAFHTALQGRPGPVVVVLPEDVLRAVTAAQPLAQVEPAHACPDPAALRRAGDLLAGAERPFVIAGGSGWTPASAAALERFAERWNLPVGTAFRCQDVFDNAHPNYAGDVGIGINPALAARIRGSDVVLAIGARLGEMTTGGYTLLRVPNPEQRLVHIHAGAEELGRVYAADVHIQSSMAIAALALADLEPPSGRPDEPVAGARADLAASRESAAVEPLDLAEVVRIAQRLLPEDALVANGAGNFSGWVHRFWRYRGLSAGARTQLAPTSGSMGYGLPAAIGAAIVQPERWVLNVAGDGDFLMTSAEMATATAQGVRRLVSIVVDNASYGTIRMHQEREHPGRVSGTDLANPDFVALAQAYGWRGERIERTESFEPALARAIASEHPTLLHLIHPIEQITSRTTLSALGSRDPSVTSV